VIYSIIIATMAYIGATLGHKTWTSSVKRNFLRSKNEVVPPVGVQPAMQLHRDQPVSPKTAVLEYPMLPEPHHDQSSQNQDTQRSHQAVVYV
jgi:hypothetical protein